MGEIWIGDTDYPGPSSAPPPPSFLSWVTVGRLHAFSCIFARYVVMTRSSISISPGLHNVARKLLLYGLAPKKS